MNLPIRATIKRLKPSVVARQMGLPISTVFRWMNADRIPGRNTPHEWRVKQFEKAVAELDAKPKPKRKRKTTEQPSEAA
jgi:antitoxin component of RelBE/YafQ-DinJ toxin-antitoxin module